MGKWEIIVVGAGPAGLAAACEAARWGAQVLVVDENQAPGGQLCKQIHKFFGSEEHLAGTRGIRIGQLLLAEARSRGVEISLNTTVYGFFPHLTLGVVKGGRLDLLQGERIILATGALENSLAFPGWTLPGVMGAGAAQTMMNVHRVLPGRRVVVVGGGNVGLIVSYQLLQAGAEVVALVEAAPRISGYDVHRAKVSRAGVPIHTGHTVVKAGGRDQVEWVALAPLAEGQIQTNAAWKVDADLVCLAVGLTPLAELAWLAACPSVYQPVLGGHIPLHNREMATPIPGLFVAGDVSGIEEASAAMEEGHLAGTAAALSLGYLRPEEGKTRLATFQRRLDSLRTGPFGRERRRAKGNLVGDNKTDPRANAFTGRPSREGARPSSPGYPSPQRLAAGPVAVIECHEEIPCNPCEAACPFQAIEVGYPITNLPRLHGERCRGCGQCLASCPGLAIFLVDTTSAGEESLVTFPFEYLPLPREGSIVPVTNRRGEVVGQGRVLRVTSPAGADKTNLVTIAVGRELAMDVRGFKWRKGADQQ